MELIAHAEQALLRNWRVVGFYLAASLLALAIFYTGVRELEAIVPRETLPKPLWHICATLMLELGLAAAVAALQAVSFARLGADIDRPLWKYVGPGDSLRRFFMPWFIIALIFFAIGQLQWSMYQQGLQHAVAAMELPRLFWIAASIPVGVCIMYGGELKWEEIPDRLAPLFHLFPKAMIVVALGLIQYFLTDLAFALLPEVYHKMVVVRVLINVPLVLLECLAFAVMWMVCMEHRDTAIENDDHFDF